MEELKITIELRAPLLVGDPRPSPTRQVQETARYLPGGVLRGAVGSQLARACGHDALSHTRSDGKAICDFGRVFMVEPPPRFGPCYPVGRAGQQSYPFPATARTCKYHPGFLPDDEEGEVHGIQDVLIQQWVIEAIHERTGRLPDYPLRCHCDAKLEAIGPGVYEPQNEAAYHRGEGDYRQPRLRRQRFSRVAIDRRRQVTADELLYTLEVIAEQMDTGRRDPKQHWRRQPGLTRLAGRVWASAGVGPLARQLKTLTRLGSNTARGLGAVRVRVDGPYPVMEETPGERFEALVAAIRGETSWEQAAGRETDLVSRLARFNGALRQMCDDYDLDRPEGTLFFCIDLLSDTIWPQGGVASGLLPGQLAGGARRVRAFASAHVHGAWHTAARMMRRTALAIDAGSVFFYQLPNAGELAHLATTLRALEALEREGAGLERERGYGWVQICAPFHLEVKPK